MSDDLVKRARDFAAGCRGSMWQSRDKTISLCEEMADELSRLRAEVERLREAERTALERAAALVEDSAPATQDWRSTEIAGFLSNAAAAIRALSPEASHD